MPRKYSKKVTNNGWFKKGTTHTDKWKREHSIKMLGKRWKIKGTAWNKDKKMSEEHCRKLSLSHKGVRLADSHKKAIHLGMLGYKKSDEHRKNLSLSIMGKKRSQETLKKLRLAKLGKKITLEHRRHISESHKGEKSYSWKGGITPKNKIIRRSLEYKLWRTSVFERDNYTCIWCGNRNGNGKTIILNADHIKPFAYYPELRFAIDNGRTLCVSCHRKTDTYGNKSKK